jgi:electron transfer flavoprotein alpha subunit
MSKILVVAEHRQGELRPVSLELIAAAQALGGQVTVAVVAATPENFIAGLSVTGVDEIVTVASPLAEFNPEIQQAAVAALIAQVQPGVVLLAHSVDTLGYAAALAAAGNYGFATDVFKVEYQDGEIVATRGGYSQKVNVEVDFPGKPVVVITFRAAVVKPAEGSASPAISSLALPATATTSTPGEYIELASGNDIDITTSEFILSVGRGVGEEANIQQFRELADLAGATLCCSRPIADSGWLPKSRQVGQSGKVASSCGLYVAMGISGAIQHLAGMKHVPTVVAVNTDPEASIFSVAKYGIVGDIFEIGEALKEQLTA